MRKQNALCELMEPTQYKDKSVTAYRDEKERVELSKYVHTLAELYSIKYRKTGYWTIRRFTSMRKLLSKSVLAHRLQRI